MVTTHQHTLCGKNGHKQGVCKYIKLENFHKSIGLIRGVMKIQSFTKLLYLLKKKTFV